MQFKIIQKPTKKHNLYIIDEVKSLKKIDDLTKDEVSYCEDVFKREQQVVTINQYNRFVFVYLIKEKKTDWQTTESIRKAGAEFHGIINANKINDITINSLSAKQNAAYVLAEGMALSSYQFLKYRKDAAKKESSLKNYFFQQ